MKGIHVLASAPLRNQRLDRRARLERRVIGTQSAHRRIEHLERRGTGIALALEHLDDAPQRRDPLPRKHAMALLEDFDGRLRRYVLEVQVVKLSLPQQLEILELARAAPEMERGAHVA